MKKTFETHTITENVVEFGFWIFKWKKLVRKEHKNYPSYRMMMEAIHQFQFETGGRIVEDTIRMEYGSDPYDIEFRGKIVVEY